MRHGNGEDKAGTGLVTAEAPVAEAPADLKHAVALQQEGRLDEAEKTYRRILESDPHHFDALHLLAILCAQRGNHAAALTHIDAAVKANPHSAEAFNNRGIVL